MTTEKSITGAVKSGEISPEEGQVLIEELIAEAVSAPEPGVVRPLDILHRPDTDVPAPIIAAALTSGGYVYVYHTESRERSIVSHNMLPAQLDKRLPSGKRAFTTAKPSKPPVRGTIKCLLHPDDPDREVYNEMGLPECRKQNLTNQFQLGRHMAHRHKDEYAAIQAKEKAQASKIEEDYKLAMIELAKK